MSLRVSVYMLGIVIGRNWNKYLYFYLIVSFKKKILFELLFSAQIFYISFLYEINIYICI